MGVAWRRVCCEADLAEGSGTAVVVDGTRIVLWRTPEGLRAVGGICAHAGARLDGGRREGMCLVCPIHGWRYDLDTGVQQTVRSRKGSLGAWPVRLIDGQVEVDLS